MSGDGKILVELQEYMGSDASIANAAWTSTYDKDRREDKYDDPQKVASIVPGLIKAGHGTPIESVILRFWIRLPIFTDRQHMTHRIASHNGLSGRYRTLPGDWYTVPIDVVGIFNKAKERPLGDAGFDEREKYDEVCRMANYNYTRQVLVLKNAEKAGRITNAEFKRARECVRGQLPTAGMVERTTIMNLRSFANYQFQRNSSHAQPEIRQIATLMLEQVKEANVAPIAISTLESIGWKF
jgi:thymidylate synthase (FAD)